MTAAVHNAPVKSAHGSYPWCCFHTKYRYCLSWQGVGPPVPALDLAVAQPDQGWLSSEGAGGLGVDSREIAMLSPGAVMQCLL